MVYALMGSPTGAVHELLQEILPDTSLSLSLRKRVVDVLGSSWSGEDMLLDAVMQPDFPADLSSDAASVLFSVYRTKIHEEAAKYLDRPGGKHHEPLPPIRVLVATSGNAAHGEQTYWEFCSACHQVNNQGTAFGPDLSLIGSKMDKEGLYRSILYPNTGISYGYETYELSLTNQERMVVLLNSNTSEEVHVKLIGNLDRVFPRHEVEALKR